MSRRERRGHCVGSGTLHGSGSKQKSGLLHERQMQRAVEAALSAAPGPRTDPDDFHTIRLPPAEGHMASNSLFCWAIGEGSTVLTSHRVGVYLTRALLIHMHAGLYA